MICGAPKNNGDPCKREVRAGYTKCYLHGAATPMAKLKAEQQLALLRSPAVESLYRVMEVLQITLEQFMDDKCLTCGNPRGDAEEKEHLIKTCRSLAQTCTAVLDRTGLGPRSTLEVKQHDGDLDLATLTDDEKRELFGVLGQLKALKTAIRHRLHGALFATIAQPLQTM